MISSRYTYPLTYARALHGGAVHTNEDAETGICR